MFGMGFMEILLIAVVAIIALGPEKLPNAMVEVAKFIKKFKSGIDDAKTTLNNELNVSEMKEQANKFKAQLEDMKTSVKDESHIDLGLDDLMRDEHKKNTTTKIDATYAENTEVEKLKEEKNKEKVSFKKKKKEKNDEEPFVDEAEKFKVKLEDNYSNEVNA